jgi:pyrroloquinoline quinone biosynthesis protein B
MFLLEQKSDKTCFINLKALGNKKNLMRRRVFFHSCWGAIASVRIKPFFHKTNSLGERPADKSTIDRGVMVKVLGTAQDGGIPHIGCDCDHCRKAWNDPKFSRLISSLALFDLEENKVFLVDATPDIRKQTHMIWERLKQNKTQKTLVPDGILLTHAHIGHYTGLMFYGYEGLSTQELPVYCSKRMESFLTRNGPWNQLIDLKNIITHPIEPEHVFSLTPSLKIEAFQVPHRDEYTDTLGFKITGKRKSLLYIPDIHKWEMWARPVIEEVQKVDISLLDGTFYSPVELPSRNLASIGHPFITHSVKVLKNVVTEGKSEVFFTHLNHSNLALDPESDERKALMKQGFGLALEGMEFSL